MDLPPAGSGVFYFNKVWMKRLTGLSLPSLKTEYLTVIVEETLVKTARSSKG
jgi:hypothetical protein